MTLVTEPIARYGSVPQPVLEAMHASDVVIWVWPVFITFTPAHRAMGRKREESGTQLHEQRMKPYHIYFEGNAGLLARDYAKFPNKVLWKLAEKVRDVVAAGKVVRIEDSLGTNLTAAYDGKRLYGMQFAPATLLAAAISLGPMRRVQREAIKRGSLFNLRPRRRGKLAEPMRWKVKDNIITEVDGGGEVGEECKRLFKEVAESNRLIEIMFGYHPKASAQHGIDDPMHWSYDRRDALGRSRNAAQTRTSGTWMARCLMHASTSTIVQSSIPVACSIAPCCITRKCST